MARSSERTAKYAQKVIDSADIVREAIFRQLSSGSLLRATVAVWTLAPFLIRKEPDGVPLPFKTAYQRDFAWETIKPARCVRLRRIRKRIRGVED
jgi:hypothetical protein